MKRFLLLITVLCISGFATIVMAAPANVGPEFISLKNGPVPLRFPHRDHQALQNSECFHCHKPDKFKIDNWGKDVAHSMCISCHDLNDKGPVKCEECHKK
jgi:cytochrome c553